MTRPIQLFLACLFAAGCSTAPVRAIPDPLPELLDWLRPSQASEGGFLGLKVRENGQGGLESLSFDPGVRVVSVAPGSPAAQAGFEIGDVLLAWDQVAIDDPESLEAMLRAAGLDQDPVLRVRRGDSVFELPVRLAAAAPGSVAELEPARLAWRLDPSRSRAGWLAGPGGVALVTSAPEGPFPSAGIEVGSLVTDIDGVAYRSERALIRALQAQPPGAAVVVRYRPPGSSSDGPIETKTVSLLGPGSRVIEASLPILAGYRSSPDGVESSFYLIDLWIISLFKYRRDGEERHWSLLRFLNFSTGVGKLSE